MNRESAPMDSRYVGRFGDDREMSAALDLEDLDAIETFFMFLWQRPLHLSADFDDDDVQWLRFDFSAEDGRKTQVDVTLPASLCDILNDPSIAAALEDLGPYDTEGLLAWDPVAVHREDSMRQIEIMRDCLGQAQLFCAMNAEEPDG